MSHKLCPANLRLLNPAGPGGERPAPLRAEFAPQEVAGYGHVHSLNLSTDAWGFFPRASYPFVQLAKLNNGLCKQPERQEVSSVGP